jgi:hypothetical protein
MSRMLIACASVSPAHHSSASLDMWSYDTKSSVWLGVQVSVPCPCPRRP